MAERLKLIPICMILLYLSFMAMSANAWHNDVGNDSCLVLYSDSAVYRTDPEDRLLEVTVKANNNCGEQLKGNLAFYLQDKDLAGTQILSIEQAENSYINVEKSYKCNKTLNVQGSTVSCVTNDLNGTDIQLTRDNAWASGSTIYWNESQLDLVYEPIVELVADITPETERPEFKKKKGWKDVKLKKGDTYIKITAQLPHGLIHKHGYFIVAFEDDTDETLRSVLDPEWWETGEYTDDGHAVALYHFNQEAGTTVDDAIGAYDATASNALVWTNNEAKWGSSSIGWEGLYYMTQGTLMDVVPAAWTLEYWWFPEEKYEAGEAAAWNFWHKQQDATNWVQNYLRNGTGDMYMAFKSSGTTYSLITTRNSWESHTWYHVAYVFEDGFISVYVNGEGQDTVAAPAWANGTGTDFVWNTNWTAIGTELVGDYELDELAISDVNRFATPWALPNESPDANVSHIAGFEVGDPYKMFSYYADANLQIDFNVMDADNGALTVDINYSNDDIQGTGTPIVDDLNLTLEQCDTIDWVTGIASCNVDMNLMNVPDSNYYIIGTITDGTDELFFDSNSTFGVDNNAPVICVPLSLTGFLIDETFIDGDGTISACASDANGLVSCEYTTDVAWLPATLVGAYCTSASITIEDGTLYNFNIRVYDVAGNPGAGTVLSYTGKASMIDPAAINDEELKTAMLLFGYKLFLALAISIATLLFLVIVAIVFTKVVPGRS